MDKKDKITAFLKDFQSLLRKHDASFSDYESYEVIFKLGEDVSINIDTTDVFNWTDADNLLERISESERS